MSLFLYMVLGGILISFFSHNLPVFPAPLVEEIVFVSTLYFSSFMNDNTNGWKLSGMYYELNLSTYLHNLRFQVLMWIYSHVILAHEPWTYSSSSWIQKRQRNQRSNCQHLSDHRKSKRVTEKYLLLLLTMPKPLTV